MARQLSPEEISIFRECFNEYDQDRGGNISSEEFGRVMRKTNPGVSDEEVAKIISEVDLDGDGTINFDEFITMMTGVPYKSPESAPKAEEIKVVAEEGTHPLPSESSNPASPTFGAAARGLSTLSARLHRQRLANQVYKDAWAAIDPSLKGSIAPDTRAGGDLAKVAATVGLDPLTDEDVRELVDPEDENGGVTYERFLEFAKRQEVDDILSGYGS